MRLFLAMSVTLMLICSCASTAKPLTEREQMGASIEARMAEGELALAEGDFAGAAAIADELDAISEDWEDLTPAERIVLGWQGERLLELRFIAACFGHAEDAEKLKELFDSSQDRLFDRFCADGSTVSSAGCYRLFAIRGELAIAERGFGRLLELTEPDSVRRFRLLMLKASTLAGLGEDDGGAYAQATGLLTSISRAKVEDLAEYPSYCLLPALKLARDNDFAAALELVNAQLADESHPAKARLERFAKSFEELAESWPLEQQRRAAEKDLPVVEFETSAGKIEIVLYEDAAPNTVASFITLVGQGFYDGLKFHRVVPHFVVQGGDPDGTGEGGPGYAIKLEATRGHFRGTLGMARSADPDSAGSQFYFCLSAGTTHHLDTGYAVFARVTKGLDVMDKLRLGGVIKLARVVRKRDHDYKVEKLPEVE